VSYARPAIGQAPYAGTVLPPLESGVIPPPIPAEGARFTYHSALGQYPWSYGLWAGGYAATTYPGCGILANPDPSRGLVELRVWWPYESKIWLTRIRGGVRVPVRNAYPLTIPLGSDRYNYATNPSAETALTGYLPDQGTPTVVRFADPTAPAGDYVVRATNAAAGSNGLRVPTGLVLDLAAAPRALTVGWALRLSARPTAVRLTLRSQAPGGDELTPVTVTLTANQVNLSVEQWARQIVRVSPPTSATTLTFAVVADGMPAGGTVDVDAVTIELGEAEGTAFDGDTLGGFWVGARGLSASALAPTVTIYDAECPLDVVVSYQLAETGITAGWVISDPLTLESGERSWLTHPNHPDAPLSLDLQTVPALARAIDQGIFWPIGAHRAIVVSAPRRTATGELAINSYSFAHRDTLRTYLDDGNPLLLRTPTGYGYDATGVWLAIGAVTEDRGNRKAWQDYTLIRAPFTEVAAPVPQPVT
jgi:hypothetical protein